MSLRAPQLRDNFEEAGWFCIYDSFNYLNFQPERGSAAVPPQCMAAKQITWHPFTSTLLRLTEPTH